MGLAILPAMLEEPQDLPLLLLHPVHHPAQGARVGCQLEDACSRSRSVAGFLAPGDKLSKLQRCWRNSPGACLGWHCA